ncbi:hypothetical protein [Nocardia alni]|uniref:hypothetical protein n=1 Tax=Nocardia alni TaxID=2815723 RepID=UPI001C245E68|nr:hypothetical protein [Nocardia alni]
MYIVGTLRSLRPDINSTGPQFITSQHWRLQQLFPEEMAQANQPIADLIARELRAAAEADLLHPHDPDADGWLAMKLVMSVFHHYAYAREHESIDDMVEHLWAFCLPALRGSVPRDLPVSGR